MKVLKANSPDWALLEGLSLLEGSPKRTSRNGEVYVAKGPVSTVYSHAVQRKVLFNPHRNANPFFHLYEALWMLGGRKDLAPLTHYVKRMRAFSDDGRTLNGAYGYRWRYHFGSMFALDQLVIVAERLKRDPDDRRSVVAMWDAGCDLQPGNKSNDIPCNTHIYFSRGAEGELDMTVCNRSNDIIWGAYGANLVHMSFLMEYMAARIGCQPGTYTQMSNNFHAYADVMDSLTGRMINAHYHPMPPHEYPKTFPLVNTDGRTFDLELKLFLEDNDFTPENAFLSEVALPMQMAHGYCKVKDEDAMDHWLDRVMADDWRIAGREWCARRMEKW